jgi:hypothetical protein
MSITHCPLCVGLAVLSAVRFLAHGVMLWELLRSEDGSAPRQRWRTA